MWRSAAVANISYHYYSSGHVFRLADPRGLTDVQAHEIHASDCGRLPVLAVG
jgi:hypothetical protein